LNIRNSRGALICAKSSLVKSSYETQKHILEFW
jgi:hypothetical protein